jgi:hypothetical protein
MSDRADWSSPRIHAIPSFHPVSFWKVAKTNSGSVLSEVESRTTLAMNTLRMDQYTVDKSVLDYYGGRWVKRDVQARLFQAPKIRFPKIMDRVPKVKTTMKIRYVFHAATE